MEATTEVVVQSGQPITLGGSEGSGEGMRQFLLGSELVNRTGQVSLVLADVICALLRRLGLLGDGAEEVDARNPPNGLDTRDRPVGASSMWSVRRCNTPSRPKGSRVSLSRPAEASLPPRG